MFYNNSMILFLLRIIHYFFSTQEVNLWKTFSTNEKPPVTGGLRLNHAFGGVLLLYFVVVVAPTRPKFCITRGKVVNQEPY